MRIGVLGVNFKSADLVSRESIAKACERLFCAESPLSLTYSCVLLSTCNRTEIYFSSEDLAQAHTALLLHLREQIDVSFEHKLYSYFGVECFSHLAKVTSGLDSVVLGETEIQRQVKKAYESAAFDHPLHSCMHFLFQKCLKIGKELRSGHTFPLANLSLESMLYHLSAPLFEEISQASILFVGNSEINRKILYYFHSKGMKKISLCTRMQSGAEELLAKDVNVLDGSYVSNWQKHDLVICGTNQKGYLLHPSQINSSSINTKMIFDLSVPRCVDPRLKRHPLIHLLNIEEVGHLIEKKQNSCATKTLLLEESIRSSAEKYLFLHAQKEKKRLINV